MSHLPKAAGSKRAAKGTGPTLIQRSREKSAEEKAIYHNLTGAGTSGVKRPFMDLTEDDQDYLTERLGEGIDRLLAGER